MQNRYHYVVSFCSEESDGLLSVAKNTSTIAFQILRDAQDDNKIMRGKILPLIVLFYNSHFINHVAASAELVDDEEYVADIYRDTTLKVVVEVDVATQ